MIIKKEIELRKRICQPNVGFMDDDMGILPKDYPLAPEKILDHIMNCVNESKGKYVTHTVRITRDYEHGLPNGQWCGYETKQGYEIATLHVLIEVPNELD